MIYRKLRADFLFTGRQMLDDQQVLITDTGGIIDRIIPQAEAGDGVEYFPGILSPGFVNCHCHLELSHLKGLIPEHTGMVDFLLQVMKNRNLAADLIASGIADAEQEMLQNGIVAVGDICNTADSVIQKKQCNLRYRNFVEIAGFAENVAAQRLEISKRIAEQFEELPGHTSIVPHAPYSVSKTLFEKITGLTGNRLLTMHNQESDEENEFMQQGSGDFQRLYRSLGIDISGYKPGGRRSLQACLPFFQKEQSLILVHNVATDEHDIRFALNGPLRGINLYFCCCPHANLYITGKLPDLDMMMNNNCQLVVGTDSLASNHQLNILEEVKTLQRHFPRLQTSQMLEWCTMNGARALAMDDVLGSFERGKKPGVVWIEGADDQKFSADARSISIL